MKAALYARVSTKDKEQNPELQLKKLREYCNAMGLDVQIGTGSAIGRPRRNIDFNKVLEAYRSCKGSYSAAARLLSQDLGQKVTPGYVWNIIQHRAQELGVGAKELLK